MLSRSSYYLLSLALVSLGGGASANAATFSMNPSGVSTSSSFLVQLALGPTDSLSSFAIDIGVSDAAALGFSIGGSVGGAVDFASTSGNLFTDGAMIKILGDPLPALPTGPTTLTLFQIDLARPVGSTAAVEFTYLGSELLADDFFTELTPTNSVGEIMATSVVVPEPTSGLLLSGTAVLLALYRRRA